MVNSRDIDDLRWDVAIAARCLVAEAKAAGVPISIVSTVRDDEYQNMLYQQGRTTEGQIVTNLKQPTFHWNQAGLAFDFCPVDENGNCLWERTDLFNVVGQLGKDLGLTWGGNWVSFVDMPHFQWDNGGKTSNADVRALNLPPDIIVDCGNLLKNR